MPALRIVYVSDDIGRAETVTAQFANREDAVRALAACGLRVLHIAELRAGESATDSIAVPMAAAANAPDRPARLAALALAGAR
jgi:hypothetical protein